MNIVVLGGGISGLTAAWRLSSLFKGARVQLLEAAERIGGWIETKETGEWGPRTFSSARSPRLLALIREMGLEDDLLLSSSKADKRYLYHQGKLRTVGSCLFNHLGSLLKEPFVQRGVSEETIHAFAERRFGEEMADLFFDPVTLGVYAGDSKTLSLDACFPRIRELEQRHGSLLKAMLFGKKTPGKGLFTLKRGMQSLTDRISSRLEEVHLGQRAIALRYEEGQWQVRTEQGCLKADALFSALPAHALARLLPGMPRIDSLSIDLVHIGFSTLRFPHPGYGYLVPSKEQEKLLGMIFDSEVFPQKKQGVRLTAMIRAGNEPVQVAKEALRRHLGIEQAPDFVETHRAEKAIPQYSLGHRQRLGEWEKKFPNLYLSGNYFEGASVEACIARSEEMVKQFFQKLIAN